MARIAHAIAHAAAALALIALAAACLLAVTVPASGVAADTSSDRVGPRCQTVLCMFAVS